MKLSHYALCLVTCATLVQSSLGQPVTQFDWRFPVAGRTNAPTVVANNPFGATATNTIFGANTTYYFGTASIDGLFGTQTGLWDVLSGQMMLGVSLGAVSVVEFTLKLTQFVDGALYPGLVNFSSPNVADFTTGTALPPTRTVVEQQTGNMLGFWVEDTYSWNVMGAPGPITLNVTPPTNSNTGLLLDRVVLTIKGDLTNAPEPGALQLLGVGLAALIARRCSKRQRNG